MRRTLKWRVIVSSVGLMVLVGGSGFLFARFEGGSYRDGALLAFSIVSTTGFGTGPATNAGTVAGMATFIVAALCWLTLVSAAVEVGVRRASWTALERHRGGRIATKARQN